MQSTTTRSEDHEAVENNPELSQGSVTSKLQARDVSGERTGSTIKADAIKENFRPNKQPPLKEMDNLLSFRNILKS